MWADEHLESAEIEQTMDTAAALGVPLIRIWTRYGVIADSARSLRSVAYANTAAIADSARERGLDVAVEFHPDTLTETAAGVNHLLNTLARPNLYTYWQPDHQLLNEAALLELGAVVDRLAHLHVYTWGAGGINDRLPLESGVSLWTRALQMAAEQSSATERRYAFLEFVRDDSPDQFASDAACLAGWIRDAGD
jgi:sugar phosphate isomerase/epimerase